MTTTTNPILEMTAEEIERDLRSLPRDEVAALWSDLSSEAFADVWPVTRAQCRLYQHLCWAVATGRDEDIPGLAAEWDKLSHRRRKAFGGKPADLWEANAKCMLREAQPARGFDWDTCLHEAAHAAVACALGADVSEVRVWSASGPAHVDCRVGGLAPAAIAKIQLAASEVGELAGTTGPYGDWHYRTDFAQAREIAGQVAATEAGATTRIETWRAEVRELLLERVHEVIAVARALSANLSLDGAELRQCIAQA